MDKKLEWIGNGLGIILTTIQTNEIFQIISLIFTLISTLTTLAYTLWQWYKKAIVDQKIDQKEVEEVIQLVKDNMEDLKENIDKMEDENAKR